MKEPRQPSKSIWQRSVFVPGLAVIGLVVLGRLLGLFQSLEWRTLDSFLRWRPAEPQDRRVLVVGIDEADLQSLSTYPVPDATLAALVQTLAQHQPRAIGIDIFRNFRVPPGHEDLVTTLTTLPNVYGIEKISEPWVESPPSLPPSELGLLTFPSIQTGLSAGLT
ncbi:MAG: CHASE2 domain-containing protein [Leptolyngbyaceae cyanobacterium SM2_3_12]|nr:CHASE2 domain-containing protein [Leptolyngbyaceae cyanobacterium SM2_3_12]